MKAILQLVINGQDGTSTVKEIASINRKDLSQASLGMSLEESKQINNKLQKCIVDQQIKDFLKDCRICSDCNQFKNIKGYCSMIYRTIFGKIQIKSPRLINCSCYSNKEKTYSPLAKVLLNKISPELEYIETKWASLMSYGMSAKLLTDILPVEISASSVFNTTQKVASKIEKELDKEQWSFIDMSPGEIEKLPDPDLPLAVEIDGGFIHAREGDNRKAGWFEAIVGKSMHPEKDVKRFAYVTTYDTKPKRKLYDMLISQGMQLNQQITFFSDGDEKLKDLQSYINPQSEHILDWFHITTRITVLKNISNSIDQKIKKEVQKLLDKVKWRLWHGNVYKARKYLEDLSDEIYSNNSAKKFEKYFDEFSTYIYNNQRLLVNYDERYRHGEIVTTSVAESTVNEIISKRMVKKQQMRWTQKGAHLLLQVRVKTLNNELKSCFTKWNPGMATINDEVILEAA